MGLFQQLLIAFNLKSAEDNVGLIYADGFDKYSLDGCDCLTCGKPAEAHQSPVASPQTAVGKAVFSGLTAYFTDTDPALYKALKGATLTSKSFALTMEQFAALQKKQAQTLTEFKKQVNKTMYAKAKGVVAKGDKAVEEVAADLAAATGLAPSEIKQMLQSMAADGGPQNLPAKKYQQLMEGIITPSQYKEAISGKAYATTPIHQNSGVMSKKWPTQAATWGWDSASVSFTARQVAPEVCRCRHDVGFHALLYDPAGDPVHRCVKCSCSEKRVVKADMTVISANCGRCHGTAPPIATVHEQKRDDGQTQDVLAIQCPECGYAYVSQIMKGPFDTIMDPEAAKVMTKAEAKAKLAKMPIFTGEKYSMAPIEVDENDGGSVGKPWGPGSPLPADWLDPPKSKPFITDV